jgi:ribonuclease T1
VLFHNQLLRWQALPKIGLVTALLCSTLIGLSVHARESVSDVVALTELSTEAQETHRLILVGGPFPYEKDGIAFGNRERVLPAKKRGFYREYTVRTRGVRSRGARRIVCGGNLPTNPESCFYTGDHYTTFQKIVQ